MFSCLYKDIYKSDIWVSELSSANKRYRDISIINVGLVWGTNLFYLFFLFLGGEILPSSHVLISWAGMHRCTAPDSYFFQFKERSSGGRAGCKCEGENLAITTCSLKPAALKKDWKHSSELSCADLSRVHSRLLSHHCVTVLLICCFFGALIFIPIPNPCISSLLCLCAFH